MGDDSDDADDAVVGVPPAGSAVPSGGEALIIGQRVAVYWKPHREWLIGSLLSVSQQLGSCQRSGYQISVKCAPEPTTEPAPMPRADATGVLPCSGMKMAT